MPIGLGVFHTIFHQPLVFVCVFRGGSFQHMDGLSALCAQFN
jgi:hypothetical protein